ncbi:MFS polyamine transporter [Mycena maculata]|uniref:MFS polyamine transporter n=1 Tax=Mycena maculata TaxID=230809 RepID=A0AAD7NDC7_9AGAR|nr:MFS polyamine transporter [Mycena maculata]
MMEPRSRPSSAQTSTTVFNCSALVSTVPSRLERELANDEEDIHRYGGDDPHEPPPKSPGRVRVPSPPPPPLDPEEIAWDGPDDQENPQNWTDGRKWLITITCVIMTVNVTFASSAPSSATAAIMKAFDVKAEISYLITSTFLLGYVFGPLFWGPGSELIGRRRIFLITMTAYTILHLGQALAKNIETLLITRVMVDIWSSEKRILATSLFSASGFLGPVIGPIVAGYIVDSTLSWRWVFWVMMIFAGSCTLVMIAALPETYAPVLLLKKVRARHAADPAGAQHLYAAHERQDWTPRGVLHRTLFRPFQMLAGEPILMLVTFYLSLVYGVMYGPSRLVFIGVGIGTSLGAAMNVYFLRHYPTLIKTWRGFPPPEERLQGGMVGGCAFVVGIFWLGWTGQYPSVPWYVPAISTVLVGLSISSIFISFLGYLVETYLMYSASAFAANTFCRSLVAAAFPLFTVQMFTKLGVNWAATLLGGVGLLLAPMPFLFYKYGARVRAGSKFAPCVDLKIAKILQDEKMAAEKTV